MNSKKLEFGDYVAAAATAIIAICVIVVFITGIIYSAQSDAGTLTGGVPANINATNISASNNVTAGGNVSALNIVGAANYVLNGRYYMRSTAPTLLAGSGWDAGASLTASNGTDSFYITLAASGVPTSTGGVLTMPQAAGGTGWRCMAQQAAMPIGADRMLDLAQSGIAQVVATNRMISTGAAVAVTAGQAVRVFCRGF